MALNGRTIRVKDSGFAGGAGVDGEGVNATRNQGVEGIIYEAMTLQTGRVDEAFAHDPHAEMAAFTGPRMARVQVAVVLHFQQLGLQCGTQCVVDFLGVD